MKHYLILTERKGKGKSSYDNLLYAAPIEGSRADVEALVSDFIQKRRLNPANIDKTITRLA